MALSKEKSSRKETVVELVELSTNKRRKAILIGVSLDELDEHSINTIVGFFTRRAEMDPTLSQTDCNGLRYSYALLSDDDGADSSSAAAIVEKLLLYEGLIENLIDRDKDISAQDEKIIRNVIGGEDQTDSPNQGWFNFAAMRSHFFEIFSHFFSGERVMNASPARLVIGLALITQYAYRFCKRLMEYGREVLGSLMPIQIFSILCQALSAILTHLAGIHWTDVVRKLGGWMSITSSTALSCVTQDVLGVSLMNPRIYFGVGVVSLTIGAILYYFTTE